VINLGPHAAFIIAAYLAWVVVVTALIVWVIGDYRAQQRLLDELEAHGVTRRSTAIKQSAKESA
jgi:heme exporter protein D